MTGVQTCALPIFHSPASFFAQEYPAFRVTVVPFYIDKYEVTNADFKRFIDANPQWSKAKIPDSLQDGNYLKDWDGNKYPKLKGKFPVVYVSWYAANAYARWKGKRLPMEVELECASKGLNETPSYPWGNADADATKANYQQSQVGQPVKVGSYPPNSLGLFDMAGNVSEFCLDKWRTNDYANKEKFKDNGYVFIPPLAEDKNKVVIRGGSWNSPAAALLTTHRESFPANSCIAEVGFRCAASLPVTQNLR